MKQRWIPLLMAAFLLSGCGAAEEQAIDVTAPAEIVVVTETPSPETPESTVNEENGTMTVIIGERSYTLLLENNAAAEAFCAFCPATLQMQELNGNEKYTYLEEDFPSAPESVGEIHAGDLMLFGSSCVVLFYESFHSSYSYTPIGHLEDAEDLREAIDAGSVQIIFQ